MNRCYDLGLLKDFGYCRAQSSEKDFLATLKISDVGRSLKGELDRITFLASESAFSLWEMPTCLGIQRKLKERWGVVLR